MQDFEKLTLKKYPINLGRRQHELLQCFVEHPDSSAYQIISVYKEKQYEQNEYRDVKNRINRLRELRLIDKVNKKQNKHNARYYRLNIRGIYYIITNEKSMPYGLLKALLKNYDDNPVFNLFLYPYIQKDTLLKIIDSAVFSRIFSYLHECCEKINDTLEKIKRTHNQTGEWLYTCNPEKLRECLKQDFKWIWLEDAKIQQNQDEKEMRIKISYKTNFILINIDKRTNKAILRFRERKNRKSKVRFINYIDRFIIKLYAMPPKEQHVLNFLIFCQARVPELIFSMISDYGTRSRAPAMEILGQDHNFTQALKKTKYQFDRRYELIQKRKK
jgi:hypothetical protein